ncbi:hypothetical protein Hanom_Chr10g00912231 [Helianthus anomalus]
MSEHEPNRKPDSRPHSTRPTFRQTSHLSFSPAHEAQESVQKLTLIPNPGTARIRFCT